MATRIDIQQACVQRHDYVDHCMEDGGEIIRTNWAVAAYAAESGPYIFHLCMQTEAGAEAFKRRVEQNGSIDPDLWIDDTPRGLPDYVTNWQQPEYN